MDQLAPRDFGSSTANQGKISTPGIPVVVDTGDEASEFVAVATSLLDECLDNISSEKLEETILLFRRVLDSSSPRQSLHLDILRQLIFAMGLKYVSDGDWSMMLELDGLEERMKEAKATQSSLDIADENEDVREMAEAGQNALDELRKSIPLSKINSIIFLLQQALERLPPTHPKRSAALTALSCAMYLEIHHSNVVPNIKYVGSISQDSESDNRDAENLQIVDILNLIAVTLSVGKVMGSATELSEVDSVESTSPVPKGDGETSLGSGEDISLLEYGTSLLDTFNASGSIDHLNNSIDMLRMGLTKVSTSNPDYDGGLNNLGVALRKRFEQQGNAEDLDESISLDRQVLKLHAHPHPLHSGSLNNLANALAARFEMLGNDNDLEESIRLQEQALELRSSSHPFHSASLNNLANRLQTRFEHEGNAHDLDKSISLHRQSLELQPVTHPLRAMSLNNLANGLSMRFQQEGDGNDLDEAISLYRQALELRPSPHPERSVSLNTLANGLSTRFQERRDVHDLDEAISLHRQALSLHPSPHPSRSTSLNSLANGLFIRFEQRRNDRDLDESISFFREALELRSSPHPLRSTSLNNLATAIFARFTQHGDTNNLKESIPLFKEALELRATPHPLRSTSLNNLANALSIRFQLAGQDQDLEESAKLYRENIQLLPLSHPHQPISLQSLAGLYMSAYKRTLEKSRLDEAMGLFSDAVRCISSSPSQRYLGARSWARAADHHQHPSALQAFDIAIGLMPQLAALGLDVQSRQERLTKSTDGLARHAAQCAIHAGDFGKAVEFLEAGRSIFWSQFLSLRSPLEDLHEVFPRLAEDLRSISQELEAASHRAQINGNLSNYEKLELEAEASRFEKLAKHWADTVDEARRQEGFEDFLRPQRLSALQAAASEHPIIYLVANDDSSDCLILASADVHHVPLPKLPSSVLATLVQLIKVAASEHLVSRSLIQDTLKGLADGPPAVDTIGQGYLEEDRGMRPERGVSNRISSDDIFRDVLGKLWDGAVKPVIDVLGLVKSDKPPKLTWCPTGLFTFLPIHAAGHYGKDESNCAADYFISSYTPTIGALLTSDEHSRELFNMMAVIQSKTLPSTREELRKIEEHVANSSLTKFGIPEAPASLESVASQLSAASIVHFACHGKQNLTNPLQSGLEIEGEHLTIARIMKELVPDGSLAFLSACETAMGDENIPDEAMNIASSLLFTGFRSVVATMWRIWDKDGPVIADVFYRELFKGPDGNPMKVPDTKRSGEALWTAVNELRSRGAEFRRWVPFIHMGK